MEIKITINDGGTGGKQVSVNGSDVRADSQSAAPDSQATSAAAPAPAINAGPAPAGLSFSGNHAPMAFISEADTSGTSQSPHSSAQSAGAAPAM